MGDRSYEALLRDFAVSSKRKAAAGDFEQSHYSYDCTRPDRKQARHDGQVDDRRRAPRDRSPPPPRYGDRGPLPPRYDDRRSQPSCDSCTAPRQKGGGPPAPRGEARVASRSLNKLISKSERAQELLALHQLHGHAFDRLNLATCWSRLGRVSPADRGELQANNGARLFALREQTSLQVQTFNARSVSTTLHALAKLAIPGPAWSLWVEREGVALTRVRDCNPQELSNTAWAFATAGLAAPALFDAIAAEAASRVRHFNPQNMANTAWACATAGHGALALFDTIAPEAARRLCDFTPQNLANTAWAFAKAGHGATALFDALAVEAASRVRDFDPQALANTAWAFATAGHAAPALFDATAAEAVRRVRDCNPQDLANTAWAFATAGRAAPAFFDAMAAEAARHMRDFNPQGLANTAWAFATAGHAAPTLFDAIAAEAVRRVCDFKTQALANTAWAFATAGDAAPALFDAIAAEAARRVRGFDPQELAKTTWAFAKAGYGAPALFDAIAPEAARRVRDFTSQNLANTAWAFASTGHAAPAFFDAVAAESARRMRDFNPQDMANTVWAFATAGHAAPALFNTMAAEAAQCMRDFTPQDLSNTAWAFAVADALPLESSLFDQRFARRCETLSYELSVLSLYQLHQWRLWYAGERGCSDALPGAALLARCAAAFQASEVTISSLLRQVAETLVSFGLPVQEEVVIAEGYSLDLVIDCGGRQRIAVEVDGPSHFAGGAEGRYPTGATLLKRRQLQHLGWRLVSVPYWEWDALRHADRSTQHRQRFEYLGSSLGFAAVSLGLAKGTAAPYDD